MSEALKQNRAATDQVVEHELLWRNKWLTAHARSIDDMITALQKAVDTLKLMRWMGVSLRDDGGAADDYATLITNDPSVAQELGFEVPEKGCEEDDHDEPDVACGIVG
jgi:hypothetical protein